MTYRRPRPRLELRRRRYRRRVIRSIEPAWGAVKAADVVEGGIEKRFDCFVDAVLKRKIVPLLGAGVSVGSIPVAKDLRATLLDDVGHPFTSESAGNGDFNRVAEAIHWRQGALALCDKLKISTWADCQPTRAHRYLALLACDGLISEIFTTNYDCGLEAAWREAHGGGCDGWKAIATLEDLDQPEGRDRHPRLRLYKINGCAARLRDAKDEEEKKKRAEDILLTDRQVQQFGKRHWAREQFAVTLRAKQLALSGFGSEEPQVWHVVMTILEEFEGKSNSNARFLWASMYDDTISFPVLQALVGENTVRGRHDKLTFDNVFSRNDRSYFGGCGKGGLDAGDFWRKVWVEALKRQLSDPHGLVYQAFRCRYLRLRNNDASRQLPEPLGVWQRLVELVFDGSPEWLRDVTREDPISAVQQLRNSQSDSVTQIAKCAPGLTCAILGNYNTLYVSPSSEGEYWSFLLLFIFAIYDQQGCVVPVKRNDQLIIVYSSGRLDIEFGNYRPYNIDAPCSDDDERENKSVFVDAESVYQRMIELAGETDLSSFLDRLRHLIRDEIHTSAFGLTGQEDRDRRASRRGTDGGPT